MPTAATADPEVQLMLRVQRDEPGAFAELVAAYWSRVFGKFVRQVGDRQEAYVSSMSQLRTRVASTNGGVTAGNDGGV